MQLANKKNYDRRGFLAIYIILDYVNGGEGIELKSVELLFTEPLKSSVVLCGSLSSI